MKIVFLDAQTIGNDIDLSGYNALGEVIKYNTSTTKEARTKLMGIILGQITEFYISTVTLIHP